MQFYVSNTSPKYNTWCPNGYNELYVTDFSKGLQDWKKIYPFTFCYKRGENVRV
jgi:hypothetical protein